MELRIILIYFLLIWFKSLRNNFKGLFFCILYYSEKMWEKNKGDWLQEETMRLRTNTTANVPLFTLYFSLSCYSLSCDQSLCLCFSLSFSLSYDQFFFLSFLWSISLSLCLMISLSFFLSYDQSFFLSFLLSVFLPLYSLFLVRSLFCARALLIET